jgi:putative transposase
LKYWGQHLWARGCFAVTAGNVNSEEIQKYIENQEMHHILGDFKISEF